MAEFWDQIEAQLKELHEARGADDVLRILSPERIPEGGSSSTAGDGFFAGSGGDGTVGGALVDAGWSYVWRKANYWWAMRGPDGSVITYIEGDIYRGNRRS